MNVIRCKNGHFFDGDSYSACPHCGDVAVATNNVAPVKEEKKGFWGRIRKDKTAEVQPENNNISFVAPHIDLGNTPTDAMDPSGCGCYKKRRSSCYNYFSFLGRQDS